MISFGLLKAGWLPFCAALRRPLRRLTNPAWRRFFYGPHLFYLLSIGLRWGRVVAIATLLILLLKPSLLENYLPDWRNWLGYIVLMIAALSLLINFWRFSRVLAASAVWILLICLVGKEVLFFDSAAADLPYSKLSKVHQEKSLKQQTGAATQTVAQSVSDSLDTAKYQSWGFEGRFNPFKIASRFVSQAADWWKTRFSNTSRGARETVTEQFEQIRGAAQRVTDGLSGSAKQVTQLFEPASSELADSGLPDAVYYPRVRGK